MYSISEGLKLAAREVARKETEYVVKCEDGKIFYYDDEAKEGYIMDLNYIKSSGSSFREMTEDEFEYYEPRMRY